MHAATTAARASHQHLATDDASLPHESTISRAYGHEQRVMGEVIVGNAARGHMTIRMGDSKLYTSEFS